MSSSIHEQKVLLPKAPLIKTVGVRISLRFDCPGDYSYATKLEM